MYYTELNQVTKISCKTNLFSIISVINLSIGYKINIVNMYYTEQHVLYRTEPSYENILQN